MRVVTDSAMISPGELSREVPSAKCLVRKTKNMPEKNRAVIAAFFCFFRELF